MNLRLYLGECAETFDLEKSVCNHGFFMMAPNMWDASSKSLERPLRLSDDWSVLVSISHPSCLSFLLLHVHGVDSNLSVADRDIILRQVARMLRISREDEKCIRDFHRVHATAKERGFGRMFRSPSLFEDVIKSILLCNCTWERTLNMAHGLCELQQELANGEFLQHNRKKRTRGATKTSSSGGAKKQKSLPFRVIKNFPNAKELSCLSEDVLRERCGLGYRANCVLSVAQEVASGRLKLEEFEEAADASSLFYEKVQKRLMMMKGLGPFASANVLMCLGFYETVPVDTETVRLLQEVHKMKQCSKKTVEKDVRRIYNKYSPFQSLAYWLELLEDYEGKCGRLSKLNSSDYHTVTGSSLYRKTKTLKKVDG